MAMFNRELFVIIKGHILICYFDISRYTSMILDIHFWIRIFSSVIPSQSPITPRPRTASQCPRWPLPSEALDRANTSKRSWSSPSPLMDQEGWQIHNSHRNQYIVQYHKCNIYKYHKCNICTIHDEHANITSITSIVPSSTDIETSLETSISRCSMVLVYLATCLPQKWPSHVGKYTSTMEHMGLDNCRFSWENSPSMGHCP